MTGAKREDIRAKYLWHIKKHKTPKKAIEVIAYHFCESNETIAEIVRDLIDEKARVPYLKPEDDTAKRIDYATDMIYAGIKLTNESIDRTSGLIKEADKTASNMDAVGKKANETIQSLKETLSEQRKTMRELKESFRRFKRETDVLLDNARRGLETNPEPPVVVPDIVLTVLQDAVTDYMAQQKAYISTFNRTDDNYKALCVKVTELTNFIERIKR